MGLTMTSIVIFFIFMVVSGLSMAMAGTVYKVGDASGWTIIGNVNYKSWAASKQFHVGDTILFEYNKEFHNVVRVPHKNYNTCNTTTPYATVATGNDSFTVKRPGHFYFICGVPGHCEAGQKVDIRVAAATRSSDAPAPGPVAVNGRAVPPSHHGTISSLSPSPVKAGAPSSHKSGGACVFSSWKLWVVAAMVLSINFSKYC